MIPLSIIIDPVRVNEYLTENDVTEGYVPLNAILLQREGTESGQPAVMFVFELDDGSKVIAKTTLQLVHAAMAAITGALGMSGPADP